MGNRRSQRGRGGRGAGKSLEKIQNGERCRTAACRREKERNLFQSRRKGGQKEKVFIVVRKGGSFTETEQRRGTYRTTFVPTHKVLGDSRSQKPEKKFYRRKGQRNHKARRVREGRKIGLDKKGEDVAFRGDPSFIL